MGSKNKFLKRLEVLMSRHQTGWPNGVPFVSQDGSFGLKCLSTNGGLYSAVFFFEKLEAAGLFSGQKPAYITDDLFYKLGPKQPYKFNDHARVCVTDDGEIILKIDPPKKSAEEVLECVEKAILIGHKEVLARKEADLAYKKLLADEAEREKCASALGSLRSDFIFVAAYIIDATEKAFPGSTPTCVGHSDLEVQLSKVKGHHDLSRPGLVFIYGHKEGESYERDSEFLNRTLPAVFNGYNAVHFNQLSEPPWQEFTIFGNPSRLANDILTNDPEAASQIKNALVKAGIRL